MSTPLHPTFEQAREDETLRQAYLDTLLPHCSDSVSEIIYDPLLDQLRPSCLEWLTEGYMNQFEFNVAFPRGDRSIMFVPAFIPPKFAVGIKSPVLVSKYGFDNGCLTTENRLLNVLLDREVIHCLDQRDGFSLSNGTAINSQNLLELSASIFTAISELRAYRVQLQRFREKRKDDPELVNNILQNLKARTYDLELTRPRTELEKIAREEYLNNTT